LQTSIAPPPNFQKGDRVLFLTGEAPGRGYVLGIVQNCSTAGGTPEHLRLTAAQKLELCCGKSSLSMEEDGRIVLRGVELTSRASGVNKIRGAAVKIN